MNGQKKVIDTVQSFTPGREGWITKATDALPDKVTVRFRAGEKGFLNMKDPLAVAWAGLLDLQQRYNKPVYAEIDSETSVITLLLIPELTKVVSIEPQDNGDFRVALSLSEAWHYLNKNHPDFQTMLDALRSALDTGTTVLVTATRHDFEIIHVQVSLTEEGVAPRAPAPPPPPPPPAGGISLSRATDLFNLMNSKSCDACYADCQAYPHCIPFKHADDGCYARAHEMCRLMMAEGEQPEKIWIFGGLHVATANVHECGVGWRYHVAPTLLVTTAGGSTEKYVIDPSLCSGPVTEAAWKGLQGDASARLEYSTWEKFGPSGSTDPDFSDTNYYLEQKCGFLKQDCATFGPPPYQCPILKSCHFITDRNTFSRDEVEAMLHIGSPARIEAAFYVVIDGFSPSELGFHSDTLESVPTLNISPNIPGMAINAQRVEFDFPTYLNRRQRITWVYNIDFTHANGFTAEEIGVTVQATMSTVTGVGYLYLRTQPNPYEIDGERSWLSTDLRVFQIRTGQSKFNVSMGSDPSAFITQVIAHLNSGSTGGQTFDNDISTDQQTSRLELSKTVNGTPVYNFAVAKVRYRALSTQATDVRVFFRLFPVATTSLDYNQSTGYRRFESGTRIVPLLGIKNNETAAIPCFAAPRINTAAASMTTQTDPPNVQTMPPNHSGAEVVRYFGCWLDFNQTEAQFPINPSPADGPFPSGRRSIQDLIRNAHQCLVSEIAFTPAPIQNGATPSVSDKLAQRNLAIVQSANPGVVYSRRIPQTFEIQPSAVVKEHDELMIDWGNVPAGSVATLYLPDIDMNEVLLLATQKYRSHRLIRINSHILKFNTGGMTYVPLPFTDRNLPGMLTIDLPAGISKGQVFTVVVRQVSGMRQQYEAPKRAQTPAHTFPWRHIVGSFQLTIPVLDKADILPDQERLLSNLRWIAAAIPAANRWAPVFNKYVGHVAGRVDALGGHSDKVTASPTGQWQAAYKKCLALMIASTALLALALIVAGVPAGGTAAGVAGLVVVLLILAVYWWRRSCRPSTCQLLRAVLFGAGAGTLVLALLAVFGVSAPQLFAVLAAGVAIVVAAAVAGWRKGCF
ncbi:MAG: hypothetical protein DYG98_26710 [Haliscomenobacteraceae bacterium CHB4]|nr:hypothetical protein [Haliscomenobacteraceae bacterium CHB4]